MKDVEIEYIDLSDEELMDFYQKGDFLAFQTIYKRHSGRVFDFLKKKVSQNIAEELLQETFEKLHRNRDKYSSQYPFLPWIFTISRNAVIDHYKKAESKLTSANASEQILANLAVPIETASSLDLTQVLNSLPPTQKKAIELRYMNDWSFSQIAAELETSEENIRQLISRGIKRLRLSFKKGDSNE